MGIFGKILSTEEKTKKPIIVLDIGEGVVKALAVERDEKEAGKGIIIGQGMSVNAQGSIIGGTIMEFSQVLSSCKDALDNTYKTGGAAEQDAVIGLSENVCRVAIADVVYKRSVSEKEITKEELEGVIKNIKSRVLKKMQDEFVSSSEKEAFQLLNITVAEIRIDGYKVSTPLGFQGKDITFRVLAVYAPVSYIKIISTIGSELKLNILSVFSIPFAMSKTYQNIKNGFGGIIIDVGYETTAVSMIQDSALAGIKTFSIGGAAFTRAIGRKMNLDYKSAEDIKIRYSLRKLSPDLDRNIGQILNNVVLLWYNGVKRALLDFSVTELVSGKVFITGGGSVLPEIQRILNTGDLRNNLPIIEMICVNQLNPLTEAGNIFSDNYIDPAEYNGAISLASFFLNRNNSEGDIDKFLTEETTTKEN